MVMKAAHVSLEDEELHVTANSQHGSMAARQPHQVLTCHTCPRTFASAELTNDGRI